MSSHQPQKWSSWIPEKLQVSTTLERHLQPLQQSSTRTSTLLLVAGFGLSVAIPASAVSTTAQTASPARNTQLLSQQPKTVNVTLVSYAVTKAAYDKIVPQFAAQWKRWGITNSCKSVRAISY